MARPDVNEIETKVLRYDNDRSDDGAYSYTVELSDGTIRHEEAKVVDAGLETEHLVISGYFEHKGPDGVVYHTDYSANTDGFQAQGAHIPKAE